MDAAILVRGACKTYGRGDAAATVLDHLDMTVPQGTIYGLLGASGCGKTTLLSCIVGRKALNSGQITLLGSKPGHRRTGSRIGYMPQDVALVGEFTVRGAINYFGWIFGMPNEHIDERFEFLTSLLDLPPEDRLVKNLSGGQQRRVSFAAALVHSPTLLILDEPTVGLDPVLRSRIWDYLMELTIEKHLTVVITTHYIEEANQAHFIGLMRNGKLLAEKPPRLLLSQFNMSNLEDVFLVLSKQQQESQQQTFSETPPALENHKENSMNGCLNSVMDECMSIHDVGPVSPAFTNQAQTEQLPLYQSSTTARMKSLLTKNVYRILRNMSGVFFILGFPILELVVFFLAIGGEPWGLSLAIVNDEFGNNARNCENYQTEIVYNSSDLSCTVHGLSCLYLSFIDDITAHKVFYTDRENALEAARSGTVSGVIYFHQNFSNELRLRFEEGRFASDGTVLHSELEVSLDMSNRQIALTLRHTLLQAYLDFAERIMNACNLNPKLGKVPMQFNDPVFGEGDQNYAMFMAPGIIMSMAFFLATTLTATIIITERHEGVWDRSIVAGVSSTEILASHVLVQALCMLIQVFLILFFSFYVFGVMCQGDIYTMIILVSLQGFSGMCFGFLTSTLCENLTMANYFSLGSFYPYIFLSGMLWPVEGMPTVLRWIALCLPGTVPIISMRNILDRGWSILEPNVYNGFLITLFWIVLECGLCVIVLKLKNK